MADELKSMFRSQASEMTQEEIEERQRYELEMQRRREFNKKQSKICIFYSLILKNINQFLFLFLNFLAGAKKDLIKLIGGLPTIIPLDSKAVIIKFKNIN